MTTYTHNVRCLRCGSVSTVQTARVTTEQYHVCARCLQVQSARETQHPDSYQLYWGLK